MKFFKYTALLLTNGIICFSCNESSSQTTIPPSSSDTTSPIDKGWTFEATPVWADEFDVDGKPDSTKWSYDIGGSGWGNHEKEYYTEAQNASVQNGILSIEARKENVGGMNYTSSRMVTKNKGDFLYGRFEIRAKLPTGKGLWPAIWMLPTDWAYGDWPKSGEVDIMEQVGFDPANIHISTHTEAFNWTLNTQTTTVTNVPTATTGFHVYRVDWTPYAIRGFIDGKQVFQFTNDGKGAAHWPFDKRFHILLNVAVGGDWGGQQGIDDSIFPAKMDVDYVRVYKMIDK
jgi:beta-glucanase (GH16 family)